MDKWYRKHGRSKECQPPSRARLAGRRKRRAGAASPCSGDGAGARCSVVSAARMERVRSCTGGLLGVETGPSRLGCRRRCNRIGSAEAKTRSSQSTVRLFFFACAENLFTNDGALPATLPHAHAHALPYPALAHANAHARPPRPPKLQRAAAMPCCCCRCAAPAQPLALSSASPQLKPRRFHKNDDCCP